MGTELQLHPPKPQWRQEHARLIKRDFEQLKLPVAPWLSIFDRATEVSRLVPSKARGVSFCFSFTTRSPVVPTFTVAFWLGGFPY